MMNTKLSSVNESKPKQQVKSTSKSPGKMNQSKSATAAEGVYSNGRLMHTMTSLVGNVAQIVLKDGLIYEGVLKTFSPKLDIVLESVTEVDNNSTNERGCSITSLIKSLKANKIMSDTMVFDIENVVSINMLDVDLDYAFKEGFKTDTEISGLKNANAEKELVAWSDDMPTPKKDLSLESTNGQTGWSAQDMFAYNEKVNGVTVGYKGLENVYTTAIDRSDPDYQWKSEQAERIAREIALGDHKNRPKEDEDGGHSDDEEGRWSGVTRPQRDSHRPTIKASVQAKPSDLPWRDLNTKSKIVEKGSRQQISKQEPQRHSIRSHNQFQGPKTMTDHHPELVRRTSNPQTPRTPPKENNDRPISFAAAVGQSEGKSSTQITGPRIQPEIVTEEQKAEVTETLDSGDGQSKYLPGESPKSDSLKKSDSISSESTDKDSVVKTSKLNPNAKEFTFNPTAKPFTPKTHFSPPPPPQQPLIGTHPTVPPMAQMPFQSSLQQQQLQQNHHQQLQHPKHQQHASQYLVMNPPGSNMMLPPHQQVIGPNGQQFQLLNHIVVNQPPGNHNSNQYNTGYNPNGSQQSRKSHHPREPRQGSGHPRHDNNSFNQHNPHNVAAATGHPVLAGAPLTAAGPMQYNHHHQGGPAGPGQAVGPNGQTMFSPMFVSGYPRMLPPQMFSPYDAQQYFMQLPMVQPPVQPQQQQSQSNNGPHSTPSTPQSQTPSTPGLHGGPSTPGPGGHAVVPQTPSPQQPGVIYPGQSMHGPPGTTFNPPMVLMQAPHPGLGPNQHHLQSGQVMIPSSASNLTSGAQIPSHFNQNQPPPTQRNI